MVVVTDDYGCGGALSCAGWGGHESGRALWKADGVELAKNSRVARLRIAVTGLCERARPLALANRPRWSRRVASGAASGRLRERLSGPRPTPPHRA